MSPLFLALAFLFEPVVDSVEFMPGETRSLSYGAYECYLRVEISNPSPACGFVQFSGGFEILEMRNRPRVYTHFLHPNERLWVYCAVYLDRDEYRRVIDEKLEVKLDFKKLQ